MSSSDIPVALVTGAARGIGRATAARLAADGWSTHLLDIDAEVRATAAGLPGPAHAHVADAGEADAIDHAVATIERNERRLDAVVANAGIMRRAPVEQLTTAAWDRVLAVNLSSTFFLARRAAPLLRRAHGAIVTIGSTRAHMSEPDTEAYAAAKGGLVALTHALAVSLGPQVRVNCVSPGWIATGDEELSAEDHAQHPAGRVGIPADVAAMVAYLLGPESRFVTGAEFIVDGGMTRRMIYV